MFNFVTGKEGKAEAVLIRAVEPLNFSENCSGPGLLTENLKIDKSFNGLNIFDLKEIGLIDSDEKFNIGKSFRIGVKNDLEIPLRFYIKESSFVSKNGKKISFESKS